MAIKGYISNRDGVVRSGEHVDELLTKIEDLENATQRSDGTMSKEDKTKLDNIEDVLENYQLQGEYYAE